MRILITGANGFIARNLSVHLKEMDGVSVLEFSRKNTQQELINMCSDADAVVHLAGINRPENDDEFSEGNHHLTEVICNALKSTGRKIPILFTSSIQAKLNNPYGSSKLAAENAINSYSKTTGSNVFIYRLPNVFGKWCKPNYNSVVATFCYNIVNNLEVNISDPNVELNLVYIDDVVKDFVSKIFPKEITNTTEVNPVYNIKLSELATLVRTFRDDNELLNIERVGDGLTRCLYSTYLSYKTPDMFSYKLMSHKDNRGVFVEMLKTKDSGQFSYFTAHPGVTRGGHYHHSKNEKFLVIKGDAKFKFRNIVTNESFELNTSGQTPEVVETIPGWSHDITNEGDEEMIVMLWANEIFDSKNPDTYSSSL